MLKFLLFAVPFLYAFIAMKLSAWQMQRKLRRDSSPMNDMAVRQLHQKLARVAKIESIDIRIHEVSPINGMVLPNGEIYITRGLMNCYLRGDISGEELASVIAHEIGHVMLGHTKGRLASFAGQNAARILLGALFNRFIPFLGAFLAQTLITLFFKRLSRDDEFAADAYASALLTAAGIGTQPQKTLFRKLPTLTGQSGGGIAWLMSHPRIEDRIHAIEKREERWKKDGDHQVPTHS